MSCAGTASGIPKFSGTALSTARGRAFGHPLFPPCLVAQPSREYAKSDAQSGANGRDHRVHHLAETEAVGRMVSFFVLRAAPDGSAQTNYSCARR